MMYTKKDIQGFFISVGLMHDRAITEIRLEPIHLYDDTYVSGFKNVISKRQILVHLTKYKKISLDNIQVLKTEPYESIWIDSDLLSASILSEAYTKFNEEFNKKEKLRIVEIEYKDEDGINFDNVIFDKPKVCLGLLRGYRELYGDTVKHSIIKIEGNIPHEKTELELALED